MQAESPATKHAPARLSPATAEDPGAARGAALYLRLRRQLRAAIPAANMLGALLVFVFLAYVVPTPTTRYSDQLVRLNLIVFLGAMPVLICIGMVWSLRVNAPTRAWLIAGVSPGPAERELALREPLRLATVDAVLWVAGAIAFAALNAPASRPLALQVGGTILLGGLATCALVYLLAERVERPVAALALAKDAPARPVVPGILTRMLLAWAFGTGVAVLGTSLVAAAFLLGGTSTPQRLAATVLFLSVFALAAGFAAALFAARSVADPVDSVRRALAEVEQGDVAVQVPVYDGGEVGLLQAGFNRMVARVRDRDRLRDLFGRHVGEDVAREALARGVQLGGEVREVAALFVDVIGSTALAATRDPRVVVDTLNRFFALVIDVVTAHGGWVNKFAGDGALCVFGAPGLQPNAATGALAAARTLDARLRTELPDVKAAIGVSAGPVVAGNVGAAERFEYTVIGDAINTAARLTELAKTMSSRLLASEAIISRVDPAEAERWRLGESVVLRGSPAPTRIATPL